MNEPVDIGALAADGTPLGLHKETVRTGANHFSFTVTQKPAKAGIDPLEKLIDRVRMTTRRPSARRRGRFRPVRRRPGDAESLRAVRPLA